MLELQDSARLINYQLYLNRDTFIAEKYFVPTPMAKKILKTLPECRLQSCSGILTKISEDIVVFGDVVTSTANYNWCHTPCQFHCWVR